MDLKTASVLVDGLCRHPEIIRPDSEFFTEILLGVSVPESRKRFYEDLPGRQQECQETGRYHCLSLRKVLRNGNARNYQLNPLTKAWENVLSSVGAYSSDSLTRSLRANPDLVDMMAECGQSLSLLGKMRTYDYGNPEETLFVISRPILIIPCAEHTTALDWERSNTLYEEEIGIGPLRHTRRISPERYLNYVTETR